MKIHWWIKFGLFMAMIVAAYDSLSHYTNWGHAVLVTIGTGLVALAVSWKRFTDKWWPVLIAMMFPVVMPLLNDLRDVGPVVSTCEVTGAYRTYHPGGHGNKSARSPSLRPPALSLLCPDGEKYVAAADAPEVLYRRGDIVDLKNGLLGFQRIWHPIVGWETLLYR